MTIVPAPLIRGNRRGVALMLVLWVVIVLGAIATRVVRAAREHVRLVETVRARTVARYAAESGVVAAKVRFEDLFRSAATPSDQAGVFAEFEDAISGWGERNIGSARYQVVVADLGARVDLNQSGDVVLSGLFRQFVGESEAAALVDALEDWKDRDREARPGGAEAAEYREAGSPFVPPNAPLLRLDELTRIQGFDDALVEMLAPYITVRGSGRVNVNTAPIEVLTALPELGRAGADAMVAARRQGPAMMSLDGVRQLLTERQSGAVSFQLRHFTNMPERILVVSRGWERGHPLTHEVQAVLALQGLLSDDPNLRVISWTERDR